MKKIALAFCMLAMITVSYSQDSIPNHGFEEWTMLGSYEIPSGPWSTSNAAAYKYSLTAPVTKTSDHYPIDIGDYSIRLANDTSISKLSYDSCYAGMGVVVMSEGPEPIFPITGHHTYFCGYYKFLPQNNDTMRIYLALWLDGAIVTDVLIASTATASNWTSFKVPIPAYATADSASVELVSFYMDGPYDKPQGNSVLYVDNLSFDNLIISTQEVDSKSFLFSLYPNPASEIINLNSNTLNNNNVQVDIYNVVGNLVRSEMLKQNKRTINISDLNNGIYSLTVRSRDFVGTQKLIIQH